MACFLSYAVQVVLVVAAELALAQQGAFPRADLRDYKGQEPQPVVRGQDRHAEHVAEHAEHEEPVDRGAQLQRLLGDLVAGEPIEEFPQRALPGALRARAIVTSTMPDLVGVAAVIVVAWFAAGTIWNVRVGRRLMQWMQGGLPALGGRTTVRWLGSSAVEMVIGEGKAPFAGVTLVIFLEPRDLPWWPLSRARGRRDTLIVRGVLRSAPAVELEALDPGSWSGRDALPRVPAGWQVREDAARGLAIHYSGAAALERAEALLTLLGRTGLAVRRLSVRRTEPNFQVHLALPDTEKPAPGFFETLRALAELALG
jgi:hypothetical protein